MKKLAVLSTAALIGLGSMAASTTDAEARWRGHRGGGAVAAGIIGGLAAGALIGAATNAYAAPSYGYAPSYSYGYAPVAYDYGGECIIERRRTVDPWGRVIVRRVRTCY